MIRVTSSPPGPSTVAAFRFHPPVPTGPRDTCVDDTRLGTILSGFPFR